MALGQKTGGRKKGTPNRATAAHRAEIAASGLTPLEHMLQVMRDENEPAERRMWAAEKAAPFIHPRKSAVSVSGHTTRTHEECLAELARDPQDEGMPNAKSNGA
jgi:hypothetical protein